MKPLPPEVSLGQLLDILKGKKPKPVPRRKSHKPLNKHWTLQQPTVRFFSLNDPKAFEREWQEFKDATPRKYTKFLTMVAEMERKREIERKIAEKRARGRARYLKWAAGRDQH
jgi:hypothetical protein